MSSVDKRQNYAAAEGGKKADSTKRKSKGDSGDAASVAQSTGSKGDKDPLEQMSKKELVAEIHKLQGLLKQRDAAIAEATAGMDAAKKEEHLLKQELKTAQEKLASREASIARMKKANEGAGGVSKENSFTFMLQLKASISKEAALRKQVQDEASELRLELRTAGAKSEAVAESAVSELRTVTDRHATEDALFGELMSELNTARLNNASMRAKNVRIESTLRGWEQWHQAALPRLEMA